MFDGRGGLLEETSEEPPAEVPDLPTGSVFRPVVYLHDGEGYNGSTAFVADVNGHAVLIAGYGLLGPHSGLPTRIEPEDAADELLAVRSAWMPYAIAPGAGWLGFRDVSAGLYDLSAYGDFMAMLLTDDGGRSRLTLSADAPSIGDWVWFARPHGALVAGQVTQSGERELRFAFAEPTLIEGTLGSPVLDADGLVVGIVTSGTDTLGRANPVARVLPELRRRVAAGTRPGHMAEVPSNELRCALELDDGCRAVALATLADDPDALVERLEELCHDDHHLGLCDDLSWLDAGRELPRPEERHADDCLAGDALSCELALERAAYGELEVLQLAAAVCAGGQAVGCEALAQRAGTVDDARDVGEVVGAACGAANPAACGAWGAVLAGAGERDEALGRLRAACRADVAWACVDLGRLLDPTLDTGM